MLNTLADFTGLVHTPEHEYERRIIQRYFSPAKFVAVPVAGKLQALPIREYEQSATLLLDETDHNRQTIIVVMNGSDRRGTSRCHHVHETSDIRISRN